jgi:PAS domain-containing protein
MTVARPMYRPADLASPSPRFEESAGDRGAAIALDEQGTIRDTSRKARELLDVDRQAPTGQDFFRLVHPEDRYRVSRKLGSLLTDDNDQRDACLVRLKTGVGPWQWFKMVATNDLDAENPGDLLLRLFQRGSPPG